MPKLNRSSAKKAITLNRKVTKFVAHNDDVDFNKRLKQNPHLHAHQQGVVVADQPVVHRLNAPWRSISNRLTPSSLYP